MRAELPRKLQTLCEGLTEVQDDWLAIENLGHGSFANVFRMRKRDDSGLELAIKFLRKENSPSSPKRGGHDLYIQNEMLKTMRHELNIISKLPGHPNVIKVLGASYDGSYFAMELAKTDLFQIARKKNVCMILRDAWNWLNQLTLAVMHLHSNDLVHLDIKSSNVLIFGDNTVRLCDFGLSREMEDNTIAIDCEVNNIDRVLPFANDCRLSPCGVDVWGIGCIALELLCGSTPFKDMFWISIVVRALKTFRNYREICFAHFGGWPHFIPRLERMISTKMSGRGLKFLNGSLAINPSKRMSAQELIEIMPWSCSARRSFSSAHPSALFHEIRRNSQSAQGLQLALFFPFLLLSLLADPSCPSLPLLSSVITCPFLTLILSISLCTSLLSLYRNASLSLLSCRSPALLTLRRAIVGEGTHIVSDPLLSELKSLVGSPVLHARDRDLPRSRVNSVDEFGVSSSSSSSSSPQFSTPASGGRIQSFRMRSASVEPALN
ncbi:hypothetical protein GUITHDRAFT_141734 [Guillardia theta CCMP2712]|uniref:Protein kinase domain-containing protein n=1 Tax=Guillardia theta (strain CCMP2712) TaxID=905079 RepID=L1IZN1_GUITC|nr:hypothetical protein GUITHDRAFT_141734 [Guillardia theta CCMP2712]EKX41733.1 hypothetical protein GUITHDRAFT_141734 [Guillardia theta CCMP2712]|eukprot:XP_005828713.1 hypothetical protein GUITHDRAFT_141734 [Guillardia theta CCMP2712]